MSSSNKTCQACQTINADMNLACYKCSASLINQGFDTRMAEVYDQQGFDRKWFWEELFSPTFWVCVPLSIFFFALGTFTMGTPLTPVCWLAGMVLGGMPFFPGDPVGDYIRRRLEAKAREYQSSSEP